MKLSAILRGLRVRIKNLGTSLLYAALLMYHAYGRSDTPAWAKRIIIGTFVYLFVPIDAIPDIAPVLGYTDDLSVMMYALVLVAAYINDDVRNAARQRLHAWLGHVPDSELKKIDAIL